MTDVRRYVVEVHRDENGYWGEVVDLPGCFASGTDLPELFEAIGEAIGLYLTTDLKTVTAQVEPDLTEKTTVPIRATLAAAI
jgi:predicted RNase H-like HicB family nuclease